MTYGLDTSVVQGYITISCEKDFRKINLTEIIA